MNVVGFTAPSEKVYDCRAFTHVFSEGKPTFYKKTKKVIKNIYNLVNLINQQHKYKFAYNEFK